MSPANLTQISGNRRHTEPSSLWVSVLAGSVLIHLVSLLALRGFLAQQVQVEVSSPIAIEFVSPDSIEAPASPPKASSSKVSPPKTASSASSRPPAVSVPTAPLTAPDAPAVLSPAKTTPAPKLPRSPRPTTNSPTPGSSAPAPGSTPSRPPVPPAPSRPTPLPSQGNVPQSVPTPTPSGAAPSPRPMPSNPGVPSGPIVSGIPLPPPPDPSQEINPNTQPSSPAPNPSATLPGSSDRGQGSGVQVVVDRMQPVINQAGNQAREPLELTNQTLAPKSFPGVTYPPSVGLNLGQPLTVQVQIDKQGRLKLENGKPKFIQVLNSPNPDYEQLAIDLLQQMQFPQIRQEGILVEGVVVVTLRLQPMP